MIQVDREFTTTEAKDGSPYVQPPPGGYVLQVMEVSEEPSTKGNDMVTLSFDIAEGEFEGAFGKYPKKFFQLVNGEHLAYFKAMLKAFQESNSPERFRGVINNDLQFYGAKLKGCLVGGCIGEVEYLDKAGQVQIGVEVRFLGSIKDVPNMKAPKLKKLQGATQRPAAGRPQSQAPTANDLDSLPF